LSPDRGEQDRETSVAWRGENLGQQMYASEGLRGALAPQVPHLPIAAVLGALAVMNVVFLYFGLRKFQRMAVS
jgi:hypothetical protein